MEASQRRGYADGMSTLPPKLEMQRAYQRNDASYDGVFFLAVRTTGIFCRPSCPARPPLPHNVEYFATPGDAIMAGYRPCKRCRPLNTDGRPPAWVGRLLRHLDEQQGRRLRDCDLPTLNIDPYRARRYFKEHYGMTFQAYQRARQMGDALTQLHAGDATTSVGLAQGYSSDSGFREAFQRIFGQTPGRARQASCIVTRTLESPVGPLLVGATDSALCFLEFADRRALDTQFKTLRRCFDRPIIPGENKHTTTACRQLSEYFAGRRQSFDVPLDYPGTEFQHAVWSALRRIPYGRTISYEELARRVKRPGAQRAVGSANGRNRIAIIIPCHRVVNKSGQLGGYGGGLWRKQFLLDLEHRTPACR